MLIVVNILLDDFTAANGATEIWPRSHRQVDADQAEISTLKISPSRWSKHPRVQATASAGSIVIRDMRTWHRGMANSTDITYYAVARVLPSVRFAGQLACQQASLGDVEWGQVSDRAKWIYRLRRER